MENFCKLFGGLLAFVYHCFDRIVEVYRPMNNDGWLRTGRTRYSFFVRI